MDTIPSTPEPPDPEFPIIAHVKPVNAQARLNYDYAVDAIKEHPDSLSKARKSMNIRSAREISASTASVFTEAEQGQEDTEIIETHYRYDGEYVLRLDQSKRGYWQLGDGRGSAAEQIDFLLTKPHGLSSIAGIHAQIYMHHQSCRLMLRARHKTRVLTRGVESTLTKLKEVELPIQAEISIGECRYQFSYNEEFTEQDDYVTQVESYMRDAQGSDWCRLSSHLSLSPSQTPMRLGDYEWELGAFAKGMFGQVTAGTRSDGTIVAVKRYLAPNPDKMNEFRRLMAKIGNRSPHVVQLVDLIANPSVAFPEAYGFFSPFCPNTLQNLIDSGPLDFKTVLRLSGDYLKGLDFLHGNGLQHRDISLRNLGILGASPMGVILDVDDVTEDVLSRNHRQGTLCFLSPEAVDLKVWDRDWDQRRMFQKDSLPPRPCPPPFGTQQNDVWALGVALSAAYLGRLMYENCVTDDTYKTLCQELLLKAQKFRDQASYVQVVLHMVDWAPSSRYSPPQCLADMSRLISSVRGPQAQKIHKKRSSTKMHDGVRSLQ